MPKYVVAYDLHDPDDHDPNYKDMAAHIASLGNSTVKVLNTTYVLHSTAGPKSLTLALQTFVDSKGWKCDFLVSEATMGNIYASIGPNRLGWSEL